MILHIAIQVRDLISGNVNAAVEGAANPAKMLKLLRGETEEAIISLTGDQSRTKGQRQRLLSDVAQFQLREAEWAEKAGTAIRHDREDLAKAALAERERMRAEVTSRQETIKLLDAELDEIATAIAALEAKHVEIGSRLNEVELRQHEMTCRATASNANGLSATKRKLQRLDKLERRVGFALIEMPPAAAAAAESEIAALELEAKVNAEFERLRVKVAGSKAKR